MLRELIDKFYLDRERDKEQHHFYITDAGKCSRSIFFKFKNVPREKMAPEVLRMFDHGDYIQMQILSNLFGLGIVRASEIKTPPQELISGRADAIITLDNELYVVDFKSMNSMIFAKLQQPKEENVNQIQLYLHYFKIPKGILLYINKNTLELKEFLVNYNPAIARKLLNDLEELKIKIDKNVIPDRIPTWPDDWQCQYCAFKEICNMGGGGDIDWNNFKKKIESMDQ